MFRNDSSVTSPCVNGEESKLLVRLLAKYVPHTKLFGRIVGYGKPPLVPHIINKWLLDEDLSAVTDIAVKCGRTLHGSAYDLILLTIRFGEYRLVKAAFFAAYPAQGYWQSHMHTLGSLPQERVIPQLVSFLKDDFDMLCRVNHCAEDLLIFTVAFLADTCKYDISPITPLGRIGYWARTLEERAVAARSGNLRESVL